MTEPTAEPEQTTLLCITCTALKQSKKNPEPKLNRPKGLRVCGWCRDRLETLLRELPDAYALVDTQPVRGTTEILSRVFESKPPLSVDALSLLGPGWDTPPARLAWWCRDWSETLQQAPPGETVTETTRWLLARLDWACNEHDAVDEFATDLRQLAASLRPYAGADDGGHPAGECPRTLPGGDMCQTRLYATAYASVLRCPRCKQEWNRSSGGWIALQAQQIAAGVRTAQEIAAEGKAS